MAEEQEDRTEEPSGKRREDARRKGQVARSRELNSTLVMVAAALVFMASGAYLADGMIHIATSHLSMDRATVMDSNQLMNKLVNAITDGLLLLVPFLIVMLLVALAAPMALGGMVFSAEQLKPNFGKLNPIKGLGRIFSTRGLAELVKALLKFMLVGTIAAGWIWHQADTLLLMSTMPIEVALHEIGMQAGLGLLVFCSAMVLIAAIDVPVQLWEHTRQLRMTKQEQKDELRQSDGDPHLRGRMRQLQRERANQRMISEVPKADVVVMNPNHYAVALRYQPDKNNAPIVVAKGMNLMALQIRDIGVQHDVPIVRSPPLARTLYYHAKVGREIPAGLFLAVAQLLAYVYQLRRATGPQSAKSQEVPEFPIPDELRRDD